MGEWNTGDTKSLVLMLAHSHRVLLCMVGSRNLTVEHVAFTRKGLSRAQGPKELADFVKQKVQGRTMQINKSRARKIFCNHVYDIFC